MNSPESIESINKRLKDYYGYHTPEQPYYKVVWSEDEIVKEMTNYTAEGFLLPYKIAREKPKYRQWVDHKYILERLVEVPEFQQSDLLGLKVSYEPLWVFEDMQGFPLPPVWRVCQRIIETVKENMAKKHAPYQSGLHEDNTTEAIEEKMRILAETLFGNETDVGDALAHGSGVGFGSTSRDSKKGIV